MALEEYTLEDYKLYEANENDIVYIIEYDNGEPFVEDWVRRTCAVFKDYSDVLRYFDKENADTEYKLTKSSVEISNYRWEPFIRFYHNAEVWRSDEAQDDFYDAVGFFIVRKFNMLTGNELFDITEIVESPQD